MGDHGDIDEPNSGDLPEGGTKLRVDRWLWFARMFKSRSIAAQAVEGGKVRINSLKIRRPSASVICGDTLTVVVGKRVRVLKVLALGTRRGPAPEAQLLYEDLTAPDPSKPPKSDDTSAPPVIARAPVQDKPGSVQDKKARSRNRRAAAEFKAKSQEI